ncbi:MAG TPA: PilZ domain-containing protein [Terriglobales bacterium]|nr:PilZ domain-containing protein [Terriglobales bacterium]
MTDRGLACMPLEALVVCSDEQLIRILRHGMNDLGIRAEFSSSVEKSLDMVRARRFDGVFIDCDMDNSVSLFQTIRSSDAFKKSLCVALATHRTTVKDAFDMGAQFVMYRPLSMERAARVLRTAQALMNRERRRSFRKAVQMKVAVRFGRSAEFEAVTFDLSAGGMGLKLKSAPQDSGQVHLSFHLPGSPATLSATGEIVWADNKNRIGVQFAHVPASDRIHLEQWLEGKLEEVNGTRQAITPRAVVRGTIDIAVTATVVRNGRSKIIRGRGSDLTENGLGANMSDELSPGEVVNLEFTVPNAKAVKTRAYVRNAQGQHYGFEFLTMAESSRSVIRDFCLQLPVKP